MNDFEQLAAANTDRAWQIIRENRLFDLWAAIGGEVHIVGSLRMGLLAKHRDIDLHIYTDSLSVSDSFGVVARLALNPAVQAVGYRNLADTDEACIEWHVQYAEESGAIWQIDMIHIRRGSRYDGYFERQADRIAECLAPKTRRIILRLKAETPDTEKIAGIEYYQAVLRDGVRTYADLTAWRRKNPMTGIVEWLP